MKKSKEEKGDWGRRKQKGQLVRSWGEEKECEFMNINLVHYEWSNEIGEMSQGQFRKGVLFSIHEKRFVLDYTLKTMGKHWKTALFYNPAIPILGILQ
jgi:hypothetical protein